jgi:hypothetical protein
MTARMCNWCAQSFLPAYPWQDECSARCAMKLEQEEWRQHTSEQFVAQLTLARLEGEHHEHTTDTR